MKPRLLFPVLFAAIFLAAVPPEACAQIYKWTDEAGNIRFSDSPPAGVRVQKVQGVAPSPGTDSASPKGKPEQKIKVILYMTDWCGYCRKARELLQALDVELVEYNVEKNREKYQEFKTKGGRGVPLIDVEGLIIKGYNADSIRSAVESKRPR